MYIPKGKYLPKLSHQNAVQKSIRHIHQKKEKKNTFITRNASPNVHESFRHREKET